MIHPETKAIHETTKPHERILSVRSSFRFRVCSWIVFCHPAEYTFISFYESGNIPPTFRFDLKDRV